MKKIVNPRPDREVSVLGGIPDNRLFPGMVTQNYQYLQLLQYIMILYSISR